MDGASRPTVARKYVSTAQQTSDPWALYWRQHLLFVRTHLAREALCLVQRQMVAWGDAPTCQCGCTCPESGKDNSTVTHLIGHASVQRSTCIYTGAPPYLQFQQSRFLRVQLFLRGHRSIRLILSSDLQYTAVQHSRWVAPCTVLRVWTMQQCSHMFGGNGGNGGNEGLRVKKTRRHKGRATMNGPKIHVSTICLGVIPMRWRFLLRGPCTAGSTNLQSMSLCF